MGKLVAFSGVDGTGKTTQVSLLNKRLQLKEKKVCKVKVFNYILFKYPLTVVKRVSGSQRDKEERNPFCKRLLKNLTRCIWPFLALLDHWFYYLVKIRSLKRKYDYVVCDRYFVDMAVNAKYYGFVHDLVWKIYLLLLPGADITIFFDQKAEKSYQRSGKEFKLDYFKKQRQIYKDAAKKLSISIVSCEEKKEVIVNKILNQLMQKTPKGIYVVSGVLPIPAAGVFVVYEIIKKLSQRGISCTIITPIYKEYREEWKIWAKKQKSKYGCRIIAINAPRWLKKSYLIHHLLSQLRIAALLFVLVLRGDYNFIHEITSAPLLTIRSKLISLLTKTKFFVTISTHYSGLFGSMKPLRFIKPDKLILPNKYLFEKSLKSGIKKDSLVLIPFGIFPEEFMNISETLACNNLGIPVNKLTVLYTGPITEKKGAFQYARVVKEMCGEYPEITYLFIASRGKERYGYASRRNKISKYFLGGANMIFLEGAYPKKYIFNAADIVIVPQQSAHGTIVPPITLLEAMASGCAVVGTNTLGINEVIRDGRNGLLYDRDKDNELRVAISKLIKDSKLRQRLGLNAKKYVSGMTIDSTTEGYQKLYTSNEECS